MRSSDTQASLQLLHHAQHAHLPHGPVWLLELEPLNVYSSQWEREWVERPLFLPGSFPYAVTPSCWPELSPVVTPGCEGGQDTRPWLPAVTSWLGTKEWERVATGGGEGAQAQSSTPGPQLGPRAGPRLGLHFLPRPRQSVCIMAPLAPWYQQLQPRSHAGATALGVAPSLPHPQVPWTEPGSWSERLSSG